MARRKRHVIDEDGYYDPQLEALGAAAAIPVITKAGKKAYETGRGAAEHLTAGLRRPAPVYVVPREERPKGLLSKIFTYSPFMRIIIMVIIWLTGIYLIRKLLQSWLTGGILWILGAGVDFNLEKKQHTDEELAKLPAGTPKEYTDYGQVLQNTFLNPLALLWTLVFLLLLLNALPEVKYE